MAEKEYYTAAELAQLLGISQRTLLFYKTKGLLNPSRAEAGKFFTTQDRRRVELIRKGRHLGLTLREIGKLLATAGTNGAGGGPELRLDPEQVGERLRALETKRAALDTAIRELRQVLARRENAVGVTDIARRTEKNNSF